jgi:uncharacterized protein (DUF169 family)
MKTARALERIIGGRWHGVSILDAKAKYEEEFVHPHPDRFCEGLKLASVNSVLLSPDRFTCPGASYAFGYGAGREKAMIRRLSDTKGYSAQFAEKLIGDTPHFEKKIRAIGINLPNRPHVLIAQLQPEQVMRLIRIYQAKLETAFQTEISSVISACGNVTVKAVQTQDMAISFACDDSRTFGGLSRDRLYAGLPYEQAKAIVMQP